MSVGMLVWHLQPVLVIFTLSVSHVNKDVKEIISDLIQLYLSEAA